MLRTYELALVLDPGLTDDEQVTLVDDVKKMITEPGATIAKEESWGKRKLAYPIGKFNEGRYVFLYVVAPDGVVPPISTIELRLNQNERVLRYLTLRTDEDLRRAASKGKRLVPAGEAVGIVGDHPPLPPRRDDDRDRDRGGRDFGDRGGYGGGGGRDRDYGGGGGGGRDREYGGGGGGGYRDRGDA